MKAREIDILLGTPARLAITASLADRGPLTFTQLRKETGLADGNLHVQTKRLLEAGYLDAGKMQSGNRILTSFQLTKLGQERYQAHVRMLYKVVSGTLGLSRLPGRPLEIGSGAGSSDKDESQVW
ncbi:MAG: transcriptional regulator [Gemmatimonadales bacterium]|nr:transcriptional regulator [Gemmatimonadales bacterium]